MRMEKNIQYQQKSYKICVNLTYQKREGEETKEIFEIKTLNKSLAEIKAKTQHTKEYQKQ